MQAGRIPRASGWIVGVVVLVALAVPGAAVAATFQNQTELASFCAGAALDAMPVPDDPKPPDPTVVNATVAMARYWTERTLTGDPASGLDRLNEQSRTIGDGLKQGTAPFYDLTQCEVQPHTLWVSFPASGDPAPGSIPRVGPITLERLADDREIAIFRSSSGRLRSEFASLPVRATFVADVRIVALRQALASVTGPPAGPLNLELGDLFLARAIGVPAHNIEQAIAAFQAAAGQLNPQSEDWGAAKRGECLAYLFRLVGDHPDNQERAVGACQGAVANLDRSETRDSWGDAQLVLAGALFGRVRGLRSFNIAQAIAADRAALSVRSRDADPVAWATTQSNLGSHLAGNPFGDEQASIEAAIEAYQAAGSVITVELSPAGGLVLQNNLAGVLGRRERGGLAANQETAIAMFEGVRASPDAWAGLRTGADYQLGQLFRRRLTGDRTENLGQAVRHFRAALLGNSVDDRRAISYGRALGNALIALGRYDEARDALKIAARAAERLIGLGIDEAQLRDVLADAGDIYVLAGFAAAKTGHPREALEILSSGKARLLFTTYLSEQLDLPRPEMTELRRLRGDLQQGEAELGKLAKTEAGGPTTDVVRVGALDATRNRILTLYDKGTRSVLTQPGVASALDTGTLLAPIITEFGGIILAARPSGEVVAIEAPDLTSARIDELVQRVSETRRTQPLAPPTDEALEALQGDLGRTLGSSLRQAIMAVGAPLGSTVTILPNGPTAILPLSLAIDPTSGHALIDDYALRLSPSLAALKLARDRASQRNSASLALLLPPDDAGLDFAMVEGGLVKAAFHGKPSQAWQNVGKDAFLGAAGASSYWHLATHGWFDWDDVRASGVVVGRDGAMLTLGDLLEARQKVGSPRLVVLSACSTGIAEVGRNPEEFSGLPSGLIMAGAAGVVASLWPVDDLSTTLLMSRFYELHLGQKQKPADALRNAQIWLKRATIGDLRGYAQSKRTDGSLTAGQSALLDETLGPAGPDGLSEKPFAAPRYWGAFVIYGE